ncbi:MULTISPECIES: disulfide isomerase [Campylobacter]|uniref:disulfide isomerase n=1 Tax=Campylobacter TaxID=194 RepID=UPI000A341565|nr:MULTISPECIES: disulfide isomerase [unclassified Campylobacter]MBE6429763.1 disulfide isomerase [Campylobacter sp.]
MKFKKFITAFLLLLAVGANAITEGKEYIKLPSHAQFKDAQNSVIEIFSYGCIHCYNHFRAGTLKFVSEILPDLKYDEWQVRQMGEFGFLMSEVLGYAKSIDEKNDINSLSAKSNFHQVLKGFFEDAFVNKKTYKNGEEFYQRAVSILKANGVQNASIKSILDYTDSKEGKEYAKLTDQALEVAKISGTPGFIVNGKYLINIEHINSQEELVEVISELIKLK